MTPSLVVTLTTRQRQVADGIGRGLSYREIARAITRLEGAHGHGITENTVRAHARAIGLKIPDPAEYPPRVRIRMWWEQQQQRVA